MTNDIGSLGEELVAHWLQTQGWSILHRRWHCRWGELDLVAQQPLTRSLHVREATDQLSLAFIEVKTRSQGNWDANGLLAITPQKQAKIGKAAQLFLARYPALANLACHFDVAIVCCKRLPTSRVPSSLKSSSNDTLQPHLPVPLSIGQPVRLPGYQLILQTYIKSAFDIYFG